MSILIFALILSFLVIIHELGHFFAAKWAKVKVEEFGLGYPPKALTLFRWLKTDFTLNWIPFGGFVRMSGEDMASAAQHAEQHGNSKGQFAAASLWQRQVIILAGATVNFLFGVVAFALVFSVMGIPTPIETPRIGQIAPDSPAAQAGIPDMVEITALQATDGEKMSVTSSEQVISFVGEHAGETITLYTTGTCEGLSCQEIEQQFQTYLRTAAETPEGQGSLGIIFQPVAFQFYPAWEMPFRSMWYGIEQALFLGQQILMALEQLVKDLVLRGTVPSELAGPVGIVHQAEASGLFSQGWLMILSFAGMLSINLAIMNVLPIPPLDGGRAVLLLLELFINKKHLMRLETYLNYGGYVLLLLLIILVTIRDVARVFA